LSARNTSTFSSTDTEATGNERQCITRLPESDAVIFSIHTSVVAHESLTRDQAEALKAHPIVHVSA